MEKRIKYHEDGEKVELCYAKFEFFPLSADIPSEISVDVWQLAEEPGFDWSYSKIPFSWKDPVQKVPFIFGAVGAKTIRPVAGSLASGTGDNDYEYEDLCIHHSLFEVSLLDTMHMPPRVEISIIGPIVDMDNISIAEIPTRSCLIAHTIVVRSPQRNYDRILPRPDCIPRDIRLHFELLRVPKAFGGAERLDKLRQSTSDPCTLDLKLQMSSDRGPYPMMDVFSGTIVLHDQNMHPRTVGERNTTWRIAVAKFL